MDENLTVVKGGVIKDLRKTKLNVVFYIQGFPRSSTYREYVTFRTWYRIKI